MPVLRDMVCQACGTVVEDVMADVRTRMNCETCGKVTAHKDACRGGIKSRYRFQDWPDDPRFFRGQVTHSLEPVVDNKGNVNENIHTGTPVHQAERFGEEQMAIRRDKTEHATDRKRGTLPQHFDYARG